MLHNDSDRDVSLDKPVKVWKNVPLDGRLVTTSLNELDENIQFPYIGMIFYSEFEDKYYKVLSIEDGYRIGRGIVLRKEDVHDMAHAVKIQGYFIGSYEEYKSSGGGGQQISRFYIDNTGDLHVVYIDGTDENLGRVKGRDGSDGRGIDHIEKVGTSGLFDTYRATYTDSTDWEYEVENGADGTDGSEVEIRIGHDDIEDEDYIQWKLIIEDIWHNIISTNDLKGPAGQDGSDGEDGKEIELQVNNEGLLQWKYTTDVNWTTLIDTNELKGADGQDGQDGQDGEDGVGISNVAVTVNNHLQITYTNGDVIDAGVINVSGAEQTIDGNVNQVIVSDGNEWAEPSPMYVDRIEATRVNYDYSNSSSDDIDRVEFRISIDESDNEVDGVTYPTRTVITNQPVGNKTFKELINERNHSYIERDYRFLNYHSLSLKDQANINFGGTTQIDMDNSTAIHMHGGLFEVDDENGFKDPVVRMHGDCYIYMASNIGYREANKFTLYLRFSDMEDSSIKPTIDEILANEFTRGKNTINEGYSTQVDTYYTASGAAVNFYNSKKDTIGATALSSVSSYYGFKDADGSSVNVYYTTMYYYESKQRDRLSDNGYKKIWNTGRDGNNGPLLSLEDRAAIEMNKTAILHMYDDTGFVMNKNSWLFMDDRAGFVMNKNALANLQDNSLLYLDGGSTISMGTTESSGSVGELSDGLVYACIDHDGHSFSIGALRSYNDYNDSPIGPGSYDNMPTTRGIGDNLTSMCNRTVSTYSLKNGGTSNLRVLYRRLLNYATKRGGYNAKKVTLDEIREAYNICHLSSPIYDPQASYIPKKTISVESMLSGNQIINPEYTEEVKAILTNTEIYNYVTLVPKVGKYNDSYNFLKTSGISDYTITNYIYFQTGSYNNYIYNAGEYVSRSYVSTVKNKAGWEDYFDEVVLIKQLYKNTDVYDKIRNQLGSNYVSTYTSWLTTTTRYASTYTSKCNPKLLLLTFDLLKKYGSNVSEFDTELDMFNGSSVEEVPSRITNIQKTNATSINIPYLEYYFEPDPENPDLYTITDYLKIDSDNEYVYPTLKVTGNSIFDISPGIGTVAVKMGGKDGEVTRTILIGNSFIQHTGNSHEELHDNSTVIMRGKISEGRKVYPWLDFYGIDESSTLKPYDYESYKYMSRWSRPVQVQNSYDLSNTSESPMLGMYDGSFIHMSGTWITDSPQDYTDSITFTSTTTQDPTTGLDSQAISDLNEVLYTPEKYYANYSSGGTITATGESGNYNITITNFKVNYIGPDGWSRYATKIPGAPVLELTQDADVRVREKAKVFMHDEPEVDVDGKVRVRLHDYATIEMDAGGNSNAKYPGNNQSEGYQQTSLRMRGCTKFMIDDCTYDSLYRFYYLYILDSDIGHKPTAEEFLAYDVTKIHGQRLLSTSTTYVSGNGGRYNLTNAEVQALLNNPDLEPESWNYYVNYDYDFVTGLTSGINNISGYGSREIFYVNGSDTNPQSVFNRQYAYYMCVKVKDSGALFDIERKYRHALDYSWDSNPGQSGINTFFKITDQSTFLMGQGSLFTMNGISTLEVQDQAVAKFAGRSQTFMEDASMMRLGDRSVFLLEGCGTICMRVKNNNNHENPVTLDNQIYPILDMTDNYFHYGPVNSYSAGDTSSLQRTVKDSVLNDVYAETRYRTYAVRNMSTYLTESEARQFISNNFHHDPSSSPYSINIDKPIATTKGFIGEYAMAYTAVVNNIIPDSTLDEYKVLMPKYTKIHDCGTALSSHLDWYDEDLSYITNDHIQDVKDLLSNWSDLFYESYMVFTHKYNSTSYNSYYDVITPVFTKLRNASVTANDIVRTYCWYPVRQPNSSWTAGEKDIYYKIINASTLTKETAIDGVHDVLSTTNIENKMINYLKSYYQNVATYLDYYFINDPDHGYTKGYGIEQFLKDNKTPVTVTPVINLENAARIHVGGSLDSIQIIDMMGGAGEEARVYIHNNAFIQIAENAHQEMWNSSMFVMRASERQSGKPWTNIPALSTSEGYKDAKPVPKVEGNPLIGVYDGSAFQMTGYYSATDAVQTMASFTFNSTTTTDPSVDLDTQAMDDLVAAALTQRYQYISDATYISSTGSSGAYTITVSMKYKYLGPDGWNRHLQKEADAPLLELSENAEVRIYQDFSIKADNDGIEFSDGTDSVHFTIAELIALKNSLNNP